MKIYFANENPGNVRAEFMRSSFELIMADINGEQLIDVVDLHHGGAGVAMFRNQTIEKFLLHTTADAIFFCDSDIKLQPDTLKRLAAHCSPEKPIISGLYFNSLESGIRPVVFFKGEPGPTGNIHMEPANHVPHSADLPDGLWQVDGCGAGCILLHRSHIQAMLDTYGLPQPWFADEIHNKEVYGEDLAFCERSALMGVPTYVDVDAHVGHVKPIVLTKDMFMMGMKYEHIINADEEMVPA
jgi:hypothetical protein